MVARTNPDGSTRDARSLHTPRLYARVVTFHAETTAMSGVLDALDAMLRGYRSEPGFQGLLCLEHDGPRQQVMIITLWDAGGMHGSVHKAEDARDLLATTTDAGVQSRAFEVLGFVPGTAPSHPSTGGATAGGSAALAHPRPRPCWT